MNWLEYRQIILALPNVWLSWSGMYNCEILPDYELCFFKIKDNNKCSNIVYSQLIDKKQMLENNRNRWSRKLQMIIDEKAYLNAFKSINQVSICTKFRDFQYRLIVGAIITNRKLFLWKKIDSQMCTFCNQFIEDEIHLFCECPLTQNIWKKIQEYIVDNDRHNIYSLLTWSSQHIIFSSVHPNKSNVINFIVTIVKQYIYRCRCLKKAILMSPEFIEEIDKVYNIEFNIAVRKGKLRRHSQKWSFVKDINYQEDSNSFIIDYIQNM